MSDNDAILALVDRVAKGFDNLATEVRALGDKFGNLREEVRSIVSDRVQDAQDIEMRNAATNKRIDAIEKRQDDHEAAHLPGAGYRIEYANVPATIRQHPKVFTCVTVFFLAIAFPGVRAWALTMIPLAAKKMIGL